MPQAKKFRQLPMETRRRQLKRLIYEMVPEGEVKETAGAIGMESYTLYKMRDGENEKYNLIRPELIDIIDTRQDYRLLDFLENLFNRIAFAIPKASAEHADINRATTKSLRSFSAYMEEVTALVDALDDGDNMLDREWEQELKDVEQACRKAQGQLEALLYTVRLARGTIKVVKLGTDREWKGPGR